LRNCLKTGSVLSVELLRKILRRSKDLRGRLSVYPRYL
jgi:hypothetical protein